MSIFEPIENTGAGPEEETGLDFSKIEQESYIDPSEALEIPPVAISIGEIQRGIKTFPLAFGTYGNFSALVGPSKSRKTFFKSILTAGYIGGAATNFCGDIKSDNNNRKIVLDFDTEQGKWHAQQAFRRVVEMTAGLGENYLTYGLRKHSYDVRLAFIEHMIYKHKDNLGLVIIDGIADLVADVNDIKQCNEVAQKLMKWTDDTQCHIIIIIHQNFGSKKPTGHLGSTVLKKAETICFLEV